MNPSKWREARPRLCMACLLAGVFALVLRAQTPTGALRGQVTDPSGGAVVGATVLLTTPSGAAMDTTTNKDGVYEFKDLAPGKYEVKAVAQGFAMFTKSGLMIAAGQTLKVNIPLEIEVQQEKVVVNSTTAQVDVNPANNANAIVMQGKDLEALSDDPDELQSELQALAGPSAGPNGGQIYIDGFTAGQLPPKSSIREIRINQNPFSAEYDKLGYGRIEIFTKPGSDKLHGQEPPYHSVQFMGNIGGPLGKKASFFMDAQRRNIDELAVITACVTPPCGNGTLDSTTVPNPHTRTNLTPRFDYAISKNNTLTARYQYFHDTNENAGLGQLTLPSQAYNETETEHTVQISDTQVLSSKVINETRFQYLRENTVQVPHDTTPTITVLGSFIGGGSSGGTTSDYQDHYELQNHTS